MTRVTHTKVAILYYTTKFVLFYQFIKIKNNTLILWNTPIKKYEKKRKGRHEHIMIWNLKSWWNKNFKTLFFHDSNYLFAVAPVHWGFWFPSKYLMTWANSLFFLLYIYNLRLQLEQIQSPTLFSSDLSFRKLLYTLRMPYHSSFQRHLDKTYVTRSLRCYRGSLW